MADKSPTAADFRAVAHDPEDVLTFTAASGYTPAAGDVVSVSGDNEVDACDATDANGLTVPIGIVESYQAVRLNDGSAGYRLTVLRDALVEGFTGLTAGSDNLLYTSDTAGNIADTDPSASGVTGYAIGVPISATKAYMRFPTVL